MKIFKKGDWVVWTGYNSVIGQIHSGPKGDCYALDVNGCLTSHDSCHFSHLRLATKEELIAKGIKSFKKVIEVGDIIQLFPNSGIQYNTEKSNKPTYGTYIADSARLTLEVKKIVGEDVYADYEISDNNIIFTKKELERVGYQLIKKQNNMSTDKVIKEYKVVTTFPTATKDYQVGEIVKKGTALFKKAHKFPTFFEAVYEQPPFTLGEKVIILKSGDSSQKVGDLAEIIQIDNSTPSSFWDESRQGRTYQVKSSTRTSWVNAPWIRKATPEELVPKSKVVTVSNNNIELTVYKNGTVTAGSKGSFKVTEVKALQDAIYSVNGKSIGPWSTSLVDGNARIVRIGCSGEDFRVSYNDLGKVMSAYNSL